MRPASRRARQLPRSEIRVLFDAAQDRAGTIRLEVGEPSFTTPAHIIDAAADAARRGHTGYGPNGGLASLRRLLSQKIAAVDGFEADPDDIVVTPGAMNALFSIYVALLDEGDEVLLPTPGFPNMDGMVGLVGGTPVFYSLRADRGFLPEVEVLERLVGPRTRVLFVNTPANPTGAVYGADLMEELVAFARTHDLWLVCDEVYDELVLDPSSHHTAAARFDTDGRVISVYSFSKVYAMTGWRVGYAVAPAEIADLLRTLQEPQVSCPSTISQKAAEAALLGPREPIDQMREAYRRRRAAALQAADRSGLSVVAPAGTMYMMADISASRTPSFDFAWRLLDASGVSVAPGSVFGPAGEGWVRLSLAAEEADVVTGIERLAAALAGFEEVLR